MDRIGRCGAAALLLSMSLGACGPSAGSQPPEGQPGDTTTEPSGGMGGMMGRGGMPMMGGMMSGPADTAAAPAAKAREASAPGCPDVSRPLVDEGRSIFTGAGNCYACHGSDAKGTAVAPSLTDGQWLDVDGSYAAIVGLVRAGVAHPKRFPAPMPAEGGARLTTEQVCAVAAYVQGLGG
jgi:mono/diheme cytochrome c family protein